MLFFTFFWVLLPFISLENTGWSAMPDSLYRSALQSAEKKVLRQNTLRQNASSLRTSALKELYGRIYEPGDNWEVATWRIDSNHSYLSIHPIPGEHQMRKGGIFHYEVIHVVPGPSPQILIRISPKVKAEFPVADTWDSRVSYAEVTLNLSPDEQPRQTSIIYYGKNSEIISQSNGAGIHTGGSALELLPLEMPDFSFSDHTRRTQPISLSPSILASSKKLGFHADLSQGFWFEEDDFFGRSVEFLWQQGNPWPTYVKTFSGISLLIQKGTHSL